MDTIHGESDSLVEGIATERLGSTNDVFEFGPELFDRIELGRVWRSEQDGGTSLFDELEGFLVFVSGQIIHDYDVARVEIFDELMLDERTKHIRASAGIDGHESSKTIEANGSYQGQSFPLSMDFFSGSFLTPRSP